MKLRHVTLLGEGTFNRLNFSELSSLRSLNLDIDFGPFPTAVFPATLERLALARLPMGIRTKSVEDSEILPARFPALKVLELKPVGSNYEMLIGTLLHLNSGELIHLSITDLSEYDLDGVFIKDFFFSAKSLPLLKTLALRQCNVHDRVLTKLAGVCPQLEVVDVSANPRLTGAAVVALVHKPGTRLKTLDLTNCTGVSRDAVTWAREKGVDVTYRFPDSRSGKKIRAT